ncbi:MAG: TAXI family TRAP transporter solute-binding subunit [Planctomycetota bacterium]|nr:TAXI family TRAP transporter solute-binding subunit [Planctomycetota bacterium]
MKRYCFGGLLPVFLAAAISGAPAGDVRYISIATSSAGGTFSIVGTAMADVINKNVPGVSANIEITGGSSENILLASGKTVEIAFTASDVMYLALNGLGSFEGKKIEGIQGIMGGIMNTLQFYVLADSNLRTAADLRGRKISVGPPGSVGIDSTRLVLEAYGMEINKDWTPEYLAHGDGAEALVDGNVDAVAIFTIVPCSPALTAAAAKPIRLLDIGDAEIEKILSANKFFIRASVPANSYSGQTEAVRNAIGSASMLICHESMPEDLIYNVVKALYNNTAELVKAYPQCDEWIPDNAYRGMEGLKLHPGAVKYLKEIGKAK